MRKKNYLLPICACLLLSACSKDESVHVVDPVKNIGNLSALTLDLKNAATRRDSVIAKVAIADIHYEKFLNTLTYFPNNPADMTAADKARFEDPTFWPVNLYIPSKIPVKELGATTWSSERIEVPVEVQESLTRSMNFLRYIIHTKMFAQVLGDYLIADRGRLVDTRELLIILREGFNRINLELTIDKNQAMSWHGMVRNAPSVRIEATDVSIPTGFTPKLWDRQTCNTYNRHVSMEKLLDNLDYNNFEWFDYGVGLNIGAMIAHEVIHNMGYTHADDLNKNNVYQYFTKEKDSDGINFMKEFPKKREFEDPSYAIQNAIYNMFSTYFNHGAWKGKYESRRVNITPKETGDQKKYTAFPMNFYTRDKILRYDVK